MWSDDWKARLADSKFATWQKFATKANAQLVSTKQYKQKGCPISGGKLNADTAIKVAGVKVAFCCNNCKGKVAGEKDEAKQLELVFAEKAFAKGFKKAKKEENTRATKHNYQN